MNDQNEYVRHLEVLLYRCIRELDYVQCAEVLEQCASATGRDCVQDGMTLLKLADLSSESWYTAKRTG